MPNACDFINIFRLSFLAVGLIFLQACQQDETQTPEAAVKATLAALEQAAEARTLSGFMEHIASDYRDHRGQSWEDIQRIVQFEYLRHQNIHIFTDIQSLKIDGDVATVELNAAMAARAADLQSDSQRLRANTHHFSVVLKGSDDQQKWLVESVAWRRGWQ